VKVLPLAIIVFLFTINLSFAGLSITDALEYCSSFPAEDIIPTPISGTALIPVGPVIVPSQLSGSQQGGVQQVQFCNTFRSMQKAAKTAENISNKNNLNGITDKYNKSELAALQSSVGTTRLQHDFTNPAYRRSSQIAKFVADSLYENIMDYSASVDIDVAYEAKRDIYRLTDISRRMAMVREAMECPTAGNINYDTIFDNEVAPLFEQKKYYKRVVWFYRDKLIAMSKFVAPGSEDLFLSDIRQLVNRAYTLKSKNQTRSIQVQGKQTVLGNTSNKSIGKTQTISTYSPVIDTIEIQKFTSRWRGNWINFAKSSSLEPRDKNLLSLSCSPTEYPAFKSLSVPYKERFLDTKISIDCSDLTSVSIQSSGKSFQLPNLVDLGKQTLAGDAGLFDDILRSLLRSEYYLANARAQIYTAKSDYTGIAAYLSADGVVNSGKTEVCSERPTVGEMLYLKSMQRDLDNRYKAIISRLKIEKAATERKQLELSNKADEESKNMLKSIADAAKRSSSSGFDIGSVSMPSKPQSR
jgi:hypothetical protein